jgi:hypothetical protein
MKLPLSKNGIVILCIVLVLGGLILATYLARGFLRESAVPAYARFFYARGVNAEYSKGFDEISRISPLGQIKAADTAPVECERYYAKMFHVTMGCSKWIEQRIPFSFTDESDFNNKAHEMQKALADAGWHSSIGFQSTFRTPLGGDRWGYSLQYNNKGDTNGCYLNVQATQDSQSLKVLYGCVRYVGFLGKANSSY